MRRKGLTIAFVLSPLLIGYVLSYFVIVKPTMTFHYMGPYPNSPQPQTISVPAEYRFGGQISEPLFSPVHAIDRIIRRSTWTIILPTPPTEVDAPDATGRG